MSAGARTVIGLSFLLVAGCDRATTGAAVAIDSGRPIVAAPEPLASDTSCPNTGLWARCSVLKRLERAALAVHRDSIREVAEPPLAIRGFELPIARGVIRVFLYADSMSRRQDQAKLDTLEFVLPYREPGIRGERTIVPSANLLVLMNVPRSQQRERIANALMAGAPQPPSKRP